jgi:hypothetical protein
MPSGLEFGVYQLIVRGDLESASLGRDECDTLNLRFKAFKQFVCQAHGPVGIMSDSAINDRNF